MCLWSIVEKVSWLCGIQVKDKSQLGESTSSARHAITPKHQANAATYKENCCLEPVHFAVDGQMSPVLQNSEERHYVQRGV
jgi:hypothetical protein